MNRLCFNWYSMVVIVYVILISCEESFEMKDGCKSFGCVKNGVKVGICFYFLN